MRPLSELFTEAAKRPGTGLPTRRGLLALAGAAASVPVIVGVESVFAQSAQHTGKKAKDKREDRREKGRERDKKRDTKVLNYALTLEHLEYAFYRDGLDELDENDDFPEGVRARLIQIRNHEDEHVDTLTAVIESLGGNPVREAPCYNFGDAFDDGENFLALAQVLENTGVMAYTGALARITTKDLQTAGATIATVEARHAAYLNIQNDDNPFPDAFDKPRSEKQIRRDLDNAGFFNCS
ncbi:MAG: ferritin-like domain-containing protein [Chloroflexia bacterium]|nr:ferritin-like domain-containing protein [Chloroflexia bacterium]MDQ3411811.1 ferritin-like domain-containing protein [Chloroflexota bacterium]